mmetsp:Transcript_14064/g.23327  ORF Transcript_14064/g.23327 Transcript_14064/m.23327 type:complete len:207 (+) Transcript_14064:334-954(+)
MLIAGQLLAPQFKAKWIRGSKASAGMMYLKRGSFSPSANIAGRPSIARLLRMMPCSISSSENVSPPITYATSWKKEPFFAWIGCVSAFVAIIPCIMRMLYMLMKNAFLASTSSSKPSKEHVANFFDKATKSCHSSDFCNSSYATVLASLSAPEMNSALTRSANFLSCWSHLLISSSAPASSMAFGTGAAASGAFSTTVQIVSEPML